MDLKVNLEKNVVGRKKGFSKYINNKRKTRENMGPLNKMGVVVTQDGEKADVLNAFFGSVSITKTSPQESHSLEVRESLGKGRLPFT